MKKPQKRAEQHHYDEEVYKELFKELDESHAQTDAQTDATRHISGELSNITAVINNIVGDRCQYGHAMTDTPDDMINRARGMAMAYINNPTALDSVPSADIEYLYTFVASCSQYASILSEMYGTTMYHHGLLNDLDMSVTDIRARALSAPHTESNYVHVSRLLTSTNIELTYLFNIFRGMVTSRNIYNT